MDNGALAPKEQTLMLYFPYLKNDISNASKCAIMESKVKVCIYLTMFLVLLKIRTCVLEMKLA